MLTTKVLYIFILQPNTNIKGFSLPPFCDLLNLNYWFDAIFAKPYLLPINLWNVIKGFSLPPFCDPYDLLNLNYSERVLGSTPDNQTDVSELIQFLS